MRARWAGWIGLLAACLWAQPGRAMHLGSVDCDTGIPSDEKLGVTWFPRGDVFCFLLADPKTDGSFASYLHASQASEIGTDLASVGLGDRLAFVRWNGPSLGEGVQFGVAGNVYAQFDLQAPSHDLVNADYVIGLPLTFRRGPVSGRVRVYHQSSHLGDEFVLHSTVPRENLSFESVEGLLSAEWRPLRIYGGYEDLFAREPEALVSRVVHGGIELRQSTSSVPGGHLDRVRVVAGADVKTAKALNWALAWSARAGFEVGQSPGEEHRTRRWSLLGEYYRGPSPYGQFYHLHVEWWGAGLQLGL
ncbi:MAG TPA: DUF1207 domain-containing protein [Candidatus Eisenbacteria bacterium]|nr:DUF1207 domain-containing protein [Candidatus Eisenbacteria bacterium]